MSGVQFLTMLGLIRLGFVHLRLWLLRLWGLCDGERRNWVTVMVKSERDRSGLVGLLLRSGLVRLGLRVVWYCGCMSGLWLGMCSLLGMGSGWGSIEEDMFGLCMVKCIWIDGRCGGKMHGCGYGDKRWNAHGYTCRITRCWYE